MNRSRWLILGVCVAGWILLAWSVNWFTQKFAAEGGKEPSRLAYAPADDMPPAVDLVARDRILLTMPVISILQGFAAHSLAGGQTDAHQPRRARSCIYDKRNTISPPACPRFARAAPPRRPPP